MGISSGYVLCLLLALQCFVCISLKTKKWAPRGPASTTLLRSHTSAADRPITEGSVPHITKHVGFIVDGNGRWAERRGLSRMEGHRAGANVTAEVVKSSFELGVRCVTLYLFSTENWKRPQSEINNIMKLLENYLLEFSTYLRENKIRVRVIGQTYRLPAPIHSMLNNVGYTGGTSSEGGSPAKRVSSFIDSASSSFGDLFGSRPASTKYISSSSSSTPSSETGSSEKGVHDDTVDGEEETRTLCLAISYGGRDDIVQAAKLISEAVARHEISPEDITEELLSKYTMTGRLGLPDPDLIIRTSGEQRLSNFLLWQSAYSELSFVDTLWPDFSPEQAVSIIKSCGMRSRRFGGGNGRSAEEVSSASTTVATEEQVHDHPQ